MSYMSGAHRGGPMAVGSPAARLDELLDQIRMTFESVSQDVEHSKSQHNDYERRCIFPLVLWWCFQRYPWPLSSCAFADDVL